MEYHVQGTRKQSGMATTHSLHSTTPGSAPDPPGGAGGNNTEARDCILSKKSGSQAPALVSLTGEDIMGLLQNELSWIGMGPDRLIPIVRKASTLRNVVLDAGGGIFTDVADMDIIESLKGKAASLSPFTVQPY